MKYSVSCHLNLANYGTTEFTHDQGEAQPPAGGKPDKKACPQLTSNAVAPQKVERWEGILSNWNESLPTT